MILTGDFCTVGELVEDDAVPVVGVPGLQLKMADGRIVTLTGLTRQECIEAAPFFGDRVTLTLDVA